MNEFYRNIIIFLLIGLYACETVVEIDLEPHEPVLVVYGFFDAKYDDARVVVNQSRGINAEINTDIIIEDAKIDLFENDIFIGEFIFNAEDKEYILNYRISNIINTRYDLRIQVDGFTNVFAIQDVLPLSEIKDVEFKGTTSSDEDGNPLDEFIVSIEDDPEEENFYAVQLLLKDTITKWEGRFPLEPDNNIFIKGFKKELIFKDDFLQQENAVIKIFSYPVLGEDFENRILILRLKHLTKDRYLYTRSFRQYKQAEDNPFAEPVTIYSNIENGFGLFSVEQSTDYRIDL